MGSLVLAANAAGILSDDAVGYPSIQGEDSNTSALTHVADDAYLVRSAAALVSVVQAVAEASTEIFDKVGIAASVPILLNDCVNLNKKITNNEHISQGLAHSRPNKEA